MAKIHPICKQFVDRLGPAASPANAGPMRAYMLDQFPFLGIKTPERRSALSPLIRSLKDCGGADLLAAANGAWEMPEREYQYAAVDLLSKYWKKFDTEDIDTMLDLVQRKSWWDSVDALAGVIGDVLKAAKLRGEDGHGNMDAALESSNMWVRRVAMLHQLGWRDTTDAKRLFRYARTLAHEKEFFIRKAIGWALRDYARHNPVAVTTFLLKERSKLSTLTVREAAKHLDIAWE